MSDLMRNIQSSRAHPPDTAAAIQAASHPSSHLTSLRSLARPHPPDEVSPERPRFPQGQETADCTTHKHPSKTNHYPGSEETLAKYIMTEKHRHRKQEVHDES